MNFIHRLWLQFKFARLLKSLAKGDKYALRELFIHWGAYLLRYGKKVHLSQERVNEIAMDFCETLQTRRAEFADYKKLMRYYKSLLLEMLKEGVQAELRRLDGTSDEEAIKIRECLEQIAKAEVPKLTLVKGVSGSKEKDQS